MIISTQGVDPRGPLFLFWEDACAGFRSDFLVRVGNLSGPTDEARFINETGAAAEIATLAEPVLESLGFRLVFARILGGQGPIVELMVERPDGTMSIEDCKTVSQNFSPLLDVHDPMPGKSYRLQISSPGIDRPLVRASDFDLWAGHEAKIELKELIDGRRRFRGILEGFEDGEVRIEVDLGPAGLQVLGLPLALIAEARLVLSEELVRESLRRAKKSNTLPPDALDATGDTGDTEGPADGETMDVKPETGVKADGKNGKKVSKGQSGSHKSARLKTKARSGPLRKG